MKVIVPICAFLLGAIISSLIYGSKMAGSLLDQAEASSPEHRGVPLAGLRDVTGQKFAFRDVVRETCGVKIISVDKEHEAILTAVRKAAETVRITLNQKDSPVRAKRRINEVSSLFEDELLSEIDAHPDFECDFPKTQSGRGQRSGYPDLRIEHLPSGTIAYLDPKLFEASSRKSSFRTFYYEPSLLDRKVNEDALHLLIGFPHDGKTRAWTFGEPELVDLSKLEVTLKAEFSASNRELYSEK